MVRSPCCKNVNTISFLYSLDDSWIYNYLAVFIRISLDEFTHDSWLLIDFLEHIVRIGSFTNIRQV